MKSHVRPAVSVCIGAMPIWVVCCAINGAHGAEVVVQNDSLVPPAVGSIQLGFVSGESAAAWLTSPCNGDIVAVQVYWQSQFAGTGQWLEDSITVFSPGVFPNPGAVRTNWNGAPAVFVGPVLTDGVLNEFRFLDDQLTIPLIVPVTSGQTFVVSFKFDSTPGSTGVSVVTDAGCQSGKNALFAIPPSIWFNSCSLGVTGDFVIRAVVDCGAQPGACCQIGGGCSSVLQSVCESGGGDYHGDGVACGSIVCSEACCFLPSGCINLTVAQCNTARGFHQGPGTICATTICFPTGACCNPDGSCDDDVLDTDCIAGGGEFQGDGIPCASATCDQPLGACCLQNGACLDLFEADCAQIPNSTWIGLGTDCTDANMNGLADDCEPPPPIPTVSQWSASVLIIMLLTAGTIVFRRAPSCSTGRRFTAPGASPVAIAPRR